MKTRYYIVINGEQVDGPVEDRDKAAQLAVDYKIDEPAGDVEIVQEIVQVIATISQAKPQVEWL